MAHKAVFEGLVLKEDESPVEVRYVGGDACYVVNDDGFLRHISSEQVDRQVLDEMRKQVENNEDIITEQTAKMIGQEDIFSRAAIQNQLKNIDKQFNTLMETGIPPEARAYLAMLGFKVVINLHGDVVRVNQPTMTDDGGED
jgi:patatin-like phospholipase/acyl hydrolase